MEITAKRSIYLDLNPESQGEVSISPKPKSPLQLSTREDMCWAEINSAGIVQSTAISAQNIGWEVNPMLDNNREKYTRQ